MSHYNEIRAQNENEIEIIEGKKEEVQLTLGQLLKIKREKMGLTITEAIKRTKVTSLCDIEAGRTVQPRKQAMITLIAFYKISNQEMKALKKTDPEQVASLKRIKHPLTKELGLNDAISIIDLIYKKVNDMEATSFLASTMKVKALENLSDAKGLLIDISIIERVI